MNVNKLIDHTYLKPEGTIKNIKAICEEARANNFMSVCVNPGWIEDAKQLLEGSEVLIATVIGFPLGANTISTKVFETKDAIEKGADEIDMVMNIGRAKQGDFDYIENEIRQIVQAANGKCVKVIIETALLTDEEKVKACEAAKKANATFVKTSTGFSTGGATVADVALMRKTVGPDIGVKASGGVRTPDDLKNMVEAGATRIGTSNGVKLVNNEDATEGY
ncbi:deoxyribose-phosphate aldolase [Haloplasma contractile]|uniref:Deoxyribose-phosphate aldolase n=1 Tax=Haloplasma contractile SSD-17B TaxID=1033810 RepID=U2EF62_9MOLU|nr:deoxyribose-phosphate aldolase [Haloplasma contractile]ERJ13568.1 Deoxyribose-phosphate aldolase protein [Haloplasma contractile SSD-17B]